MGPNGTKWGQTGPYLAKLGQMGQTWPNRAKLGKLRETGSNGPKYGQIWTNKFKPDQIWA